MAVSWQNFYLIRTDTISVSLGQNIRATLEKSAESGKYINVVKLLGVNGQSANIYGQVMINPTTNLPTTTKPALNSVIGSTNTFSAVVKIDSGSAMSGGTATGTYISLTAESMTELELPPIIVPPGVTIGFTIPIGALSSGTGSFGVYYFETDI